MEVVTSYAFHYQITQLLSANVPQANLALMDVNVYVSTFISILLFALGYAAKI